MVVFTCGHCGESVQKPKVEKHYLTICRNRNPNLSCMDCFKDFLGQDYESHIKCITEEERYSGKGFVSKEKKGEKKQNAWVEMLQSVLDEQKSAPRNVLRIIETISKHNNTPRKKPKFVNFVKNVCGQKTNPKDIDQAWDLISVKLVALSNANNRNQNQKKDDSVAEEKKPQNGTIEETDEKSEEKSEENGIEQNGDTKENGEEQQNGEEEAVDKKKLTKKQKKEEKKHKKYEAELQSAAAPLPEEEEEEVESKKGKKKKNRTESMNGDENTQTEGKNGKNKKRKRQDTVNSVNGNQEPMENGAEPVEAAVAATGKTQKKKSKTEDEDAEESICLHDQNVAKIGELAVSSDKFNWHAVIISVLEKKGNELPFKRLQKKVLGEYSEATGREVDDRIADKFIKKLKSAPNVRVDKNRVLLID
nr:cell growth-regulating nucleolar protein [Helicoverpa armigera]